MDIPAWVMDAIRQFKAPETGQVTIVLERYQTGITQLEIGGIVRLKPPTKK